MPLPGSDALRQQEQQGRPCLADRRLSTAGGASETLPRLGSVVPIPPHSCPRDWPGETAYLVASGPSSESLDLDCLRGRRVVAVSHGLFMAPWAPTLIAGGRAFWQRHDLREVFGGTLAVITDDYRPWGWLRREDPRMVYMRRGAREGLSDDPAVLAGSESSVMLAINYVVHRGVRRIVLLGCDGKPNASGKRRAGRPESDTRDAAARYQTQERAMATQIEPLAAAGVTIVNCSPGTALECYPTGRLEEWL